MSTPAIRAIYEGPLLPLTLPLLVARVLADDPHRTVAADHLALLTHLLDRRSDLHVESSSLLVAIGDAAAGQVVRSELHLHLVARQDPDVVHPHLPRDVRQHLVAVLELDPEHGVGQRFDDGPFHEDRVVLGLCDGAPPGAGGAQKSTPKNTGQPVRLAGQDPQRKSGPRRVRRPMEAARHRPGQETATSHTTGATGGSDAKSRPCALQRAVPPGGTFCWSLLESSSPLASRQVTSTHAVTWSDPGFVSVPATSRSPSDHWHDPW